MEFKIMTNQDPYKQKKARAYLEAKANSKTGKTHPTNSTSGPLFCTEKICSFLLEAIY